MDKCSNCEFWRKRASNLKGVLIPGGFGKCIRFEGHCDPTEPNTGFGKSYAVTPTEYLTRKPDGAKPHVYCEKCNAPLFGFLVDFVSETGKFLCEKCKGSEKKMRIRLNKDIPVSKEHGLISGLELEVIYKKNGGYWVRSPNTTEEIKLHRHEYEVIEDAEVDTYDHVWKKINLVTKKGKKGYFDEYECKNCGIKTKRYGIGGEFENISECKKAKKKSLPKNADKLIEKMPVLLDGQQSLDGKIYRNGKWEEHFYKGQLVCFCCSKCGEETDALNYKDNRGYCGKCFNEIGNKVYQGEKYEINLDGMSDEKVKQFHQIANRIKGCKNPNHPLIGSEIKVEPIREQSDIDRIKELLKDKPRDLALFTLGINTNLRASDLIRLRVSKFIGLQSGDSFELKEQKTGKARTITLNNGVMAVVNHWIEKSGLKPEDQLFRSQRNGSALIVPSINRLVKGWCKLIGLKGNYGSHTLRKTFGFHAWKAGIDLPRLMTIFNHSSQKQTLEYLCIQAEDIQAVYMQMEL